MDSATLRSLDRISMLPDSILCHILSFLPMEYAVQTIILSTRYQYLWTYITSLHFDNSKFFANHIGEAEADLRFTNFVNTVLLLSKASCLEKFSLKLKRFRNIDIVKSWISTAINRNVQKLEFDYADPVMQLPRTLFTCKTLVDLTIYGMFDLKIPASVWFPSLKILTMGELGFETGDSLQKLINGCPVLEYLDLYRGDVESGEVLNISMPTLKRLEITCLGPGDHLVVNTPKLEYLDLTSYWVRCSLDNLSSLLEARVIIHLSDSGPINSTNILKLLRGIANVKFLWFHAEVKDYVQLTFPTLNNLIHLSLTRGFDYDRISLDFLNDFLECSPNLQVLVLEGNRFTSTKSWSPPLRVPHCLFFHLKEVEHWPLGRESPEFEVIEYLLKSAQILKKMTIFSRHSNIRRIAQFPRASKTCKINLL